MIQSRGMAYVGVQGSSDSEDEEIEGFGQYQSGGAEDLEQKPGESQSDRRHG